MSLFAAYPFAGFRLLLPAIVPSWRFFDAVRASPRVEYRLQDGASEGAWREFRPRMQVLTLRDMARRMVWNATANETLYLVSLSERLTGLTSDAATIAHAERELLRRIARDLLRSHAPADRLQVRLRFVTRDSVAQPDGGEIGYLSAPVPLGDFADLPEP